MDEEIQRACALVSSLHAFFFFARGQLFCFSRESGRNMFLAEAFLRKRRNAAVSVW